MAANRNTLRRRRLFGKNAEWKRTGILNDQVQEIARQEAAEGIGETWASADWARRVRLKLIEEGIGNTGPMTDPMHAFSAAKSRHTLALVIDRLTPGDAIALAALANLMLAHPADERLWQIVKAKDEYFSKHVMPHLKCQFNSDRAKRAAATRKANRIKALRDRR